jgi:hypothetical protein
MRTLWIGSLAFLVVAVGMGCPFGSDGLVGDTSAFSNGGASSASNSGASTASSGGTGGTGGGTLCAPGSTKSCYPVPSGTMGVGECKAGVQTCRPDGNGYDACMGAVVPVPENCTSAKDTDCNGVTTTCTGTPTWSAHDGDTGDDQGFAVVADSKGNVIVTGAFNGTVNFGKGALTSKGGADIFVVKYDRTGKVLWTKRIGAAGDDFGEGVAVDSSDNVIVVGSFATQADFDPATPLTGQDNGFVAKLAPDGTLVWNLGFGDANSQAALAVAVDANDQIVVAGGFSGTLGLGSTSPQTTGGGDEDAFVAKLDAGGTVLWVKAMGDGMGAASQSFGAIAVDAGNNVLVTGSGKGSVDFGAGPVPSTGKGGDNILIAKLTPAGALTWGKIIGDDSDQNGNGVAADKDGNVLVTGTFAGQIQFPGGAMLTAKGAYDIFLVKLDPAGSETWSKSFGFAGASDSGLGVAVDQFGNVAFGGVFNGDLDLLGGGNPPFTAVGSGDGFVAKYDPAGKILWGTSFGGGGYDIVWSVAVSRAPVVVPGLPAPSVVAVTGWFGGKQGDTIDLGMGAFTCVDHADVFVAEFAP